MGKIKENAYIEQSVVYHEGRPEPVIYYNVFSDGEQLCEISYERLVVIRDLIDIVIKEQKGGANE